MALLSPNSAGLSKKTSQVLQACRAPSPTLSRSPQASQKKANRRTLAPSVQPTPAFQVIPARTVDPDRTEATLQAAMQSLALDAHRPVALEIASESTGAKSFLVRAKDEATLEHAQAQLRAYAPQMLIHPLEHGDPLRLLPGETVSVCELCPGAASYLPLRSMEQTDPLRGLLGSLTVPAGMRALVQLALVPTSPSWSQPNLRKAVEHPLEHERSRQRESQNASRFDTPNMAGLVFLSIVLASLLFSSFLSRRLQALMPPWLLTALMDLFLHGSLPHLTGMQPLVFYGGATLLLGSPLILGSWIMQIHRRFLTPPLYDQRMVARQTSQMAYRSRLRLYVFSPASGRSFCHTFCHYALLSFWEACRWFGNGLRQRPRRFGRCLMGKILRRGWRIGLQEWHRWQKSRQRRKDVLAGLIAAYRQFDTASANYFVAKHQTKHKARKLIHGGWWHDVASSCHYLTSEVVSRVWYLPQDSMFELPGIEQKRSRTLPLPMALLAPPHSLVIGHSVHAGSRLPFALPPAFLTHHTLIGGKSGEGKSTFMTHIAQAVMRENMALCLLDPHGDLALDVLRCVPASRQDDVVFIDLGDADFCVGFNPLDVMLGRHRDLMVASLVETFRRLWESGWGPRMEAPFRAALMTLYEANEALVRRGRTNEQYTLLDVVHLLLDESFCHDLLVDVQDSYLHRFWFEYFDPLDLRQQRERIDPVLTKMLQLEAKVARRMLGQSRSTIHLSQLIAERKLIVIRLVTGEAGLSAPLLGATVLGLLMVALREQSTRPPQERVQMEIIVDEFQSIPGADYALLLGELRKFGGSAVLATQSFEYLEKVSPHLLPTTLANVKQFFMFRLSAQDARIICRELGDVTEEDMTNLETHFCYVKLVHEGQQQPTFSLELEMPAFQDRSQVEVIRARSRRYTRQASEVEEELFLAMARALRATTHHHDEGVEIPSQNADSHLKGEPMHHKTSSPPIVDGTILPSSSSHEAFASTLRGEQEEASHLPSPLASSKQGSDQVSQEKQPLASAQQGKQAKSARYLRFEKRTQKQRQVPQRADEEITSFDLHPISKEREDEQERAP